MAIAVDPETGAQYTPVCTCGKPLKIFAASGRIAKSCSQSCNKRRGHKTKLVCWLRKCCDCGAIVNARSLRCKACYDRIRPRREQCACQGCGKAFTPRNKRYSSYCSRDCAFANIKKWKSGEGHFKSSKSVGGSAPHCPVFFKSCVSCGKPFVTRWRKKAACSDACAYEELKARQRRQYDPVNPAQHSCATCGKTFMSSRPSKYCSPCCVPRRNLTHEDRARRYGGAVERVDRYVVFERCGWRCCACGCDAPKRLIGSNDDNEPCLDHIVALSNGGDHSYDNTQLLCRVCNTLKGAADMKVFVSQWIAPGAH